MAASGFMSEGIFRDLQQKIDEDAEVKDAIRAILKDLERQQRVAGATLGRCHNTRSTELQPVLEVAVKAIEEEIQSVQALSEVASKYPYYKYNGLWSKDVQNVTSHILLCAWLGGLNVQGKENKEGTLLTIEDVGSIMGVPVSSQTDQFHLTLDEYLHSLLSLIEELSRLATNSVTLGDFQRPLQIAKFIGELHAGFQMLNLKNDSLRRRSDGVKYQVKSVEGVVYDLSLRGLVKKGGEQ